MAAGVSRGNSSTSDLVLQDAAIAAEVDMKQHLSSLQAKTIVNDDDHVLNLVTAVYRVFKRIQCIRDGAFKEAISSRFTHSLKVVEEITCQSLVAHCFFTLHVWDCDTEERTLNRQAVVAPGIEEMKRVLQIDQERLFHGQENYDPIDQFNEGFKEAEKGLSSDEKKVFHRVLCCEAVLRAVHFLKDGKGEMPRVSLGGLLRSNYPLAFKRVEAYLVAFALEMDSSGDNDYVRNQLTRESYYLGKDHQVVLEGIQRVLPEGSGERPQLEGLLARLNSHLEVCCSLLGGEPSMITSDDPLQFLESLPLESFTELLAVEDLKDTRMDAIKAWEQLVPKEKRESFTTIAEEVRKQIEVLDEVLHHLGEREAVIKRIVRLAQQTQKSIERALDVFNEEAACSKNEKIADMPDFFSSMGKMIRVFLTCRELKKKMSDVYDSPSHRELFNGEMGLCLQDCLQCFYTMVKLLEGNLESYAPSNKVKDAYGIGIYPLVSMEAPNPAELDQLFKLLQEEKMKVGENATEYALVHSSYVWLIEEICLELGKQRMEQSSLEIRIGSVEKRPLDEANGSSPKRIERDERGSALESLRQMIREVQQAGTINETQQLALFSNIKRVFPNKEANIFTAISSEKVYGKSSPLTRHRLLTFEKMGKLDEKIGKLEQESCSV